MEYVAAEWAKVVAIQRALLRAFENSSKEVGLRMELMVGLGGIYFYASVLHFDMPLEG